MEGKLPAIHQQVTQADEETAELRYTRCERLGERFPSLQGKTRLQGPLELLFQVPLGSQDCLALGAAAEHPGFGPAGLGGRRCCLTPAEPEASPASGRRSILQSGKWLLSSTTPCCSVCVKKLCLLLPSYIILLGGLLRPVHFGPHNGVHGVKGARLLSLSGGNLTREG